MTNPKRLGGIARAKVDGRKGALNHDTESMVDGGLHFEEDGNLSHAALEGSQVLRHLIQWRN
jgi:hypothetical protein